MGPRTTRQRTLSISHANVTRWGPQAEGFCAGATPEVLMIAEAHLNAASFENVGNRMSRHGWNPYRANAFPTGKSVEGTSAGVCVFTRKSHLASPVDECVIASSALGHDPMFLKWVPVVLRLKGVSALLVELYLITGIGMVGQNLEILQQMLVLKSLFNMPAIVAADWQCTPDQLAETGWLDRGYDSGCS